MKTRSFVTLGAACLLALTACSGGGDTNAQNTASASSPHQSSSASRSASATPSASVKPVMPERTPVVNDDSTMQPSASSSSAPNPSNSAQVWTSPGAVKTGTVTTASADPNAGNPTNVRRAGETCGSISQQGHLRGSNAQLRVVDGVVDCDYAMSIMTQYINSTPTPDNQTQHWVMRIQDATCYWRPFLDYTPDRGAPECVVEGHNIKITARLDDPEAAMRAYNELDPENPEYQSED